MEEKKKLQEKDKQIREENKKISEVINRLFKEAKEKENKNR